MGDKYTVGSETMSRLLYEESINRIRYMSLPDDNETDNRFYIYELRSLTFYPTTRIASIDFLRTTHYRIIVKYETLNYNRMPILSDWREKTKVINKNIKLSNEMIECLNEHSDPLIKFFACEIVYGLNDPNLYPSWFINKCMAIDLEFYLKQYDKYLEEFIAEKQAKIDEYDFRIKSLNLKAQEYQDRINKLKDEVDCKNEEYERVKTKNEKIKNRKILSTFINKKQLDDRQIILKQEYLNALNKYNAQKERLKENTDEISACNDIIIVLKKDIANKKKTINDIKETKSIDFYRKYNGTVELPKQKILNDEFFPLKDLMSAEYEKIIGCYIIHNVENDKCYVGQSKDVIKRLKQHFKGTVPNNHIFADDYYHSSLSNVEELFEVMVIPCKTKDELDAEERRLIEEYGAFRFGYNGTGGNL